MGDTRDMNRVHERIDMLQEKRLEDLKETNKVLTNIKESISSIETSLENQRQSVNDLSKLTSRLQNKRKDWDKVIDKAIARHVAECDATDMVELERDYGGGGEKLRKFAGKHPYVTGGGGGAVATTIVLKAASLLMGIL